MKEKAYLQQLGLERHPFPVAPDDENFYISPHIEQVIVELVHGISARKGFMVFSGDVGLGKTTITRRVLTILAAQQIRTALVFHTSLKDVDLLREINRDFGMDVEGADVHADQCGGQLNRLYDFLMTQYRQGHNCAIIIDDAQNLDRRSLELVRMISNLETDQQKLVQILLVGQPELMDTLNTDALRQLRSRIVIRKAAQPLNRQELRNYVLFKLSLAGNQGRIAVTNAAFRSLYRRTRGNFRRLNMLMDRCLYGICRANRPAIDNDVVRLADADLHPERHLRMRRALAFAASVALPFMLVLGSWLSHLHISRSALAESVPPQIYLKVPQPPAESMKSPRAAAMPVAGKSGHARAVSEVTAFLRSYQLTHYADAFERALSDGTLPLLADRIYRESGLQLIQLASLSQTNRRHYGALAVPQGPHHAPAWLILWRPSLTLNRFYYRYQGQEILRLQQLLADAGVYRNRLDGVVGTALMKAVIAFQQRHSIPLTGFPDAATVFLLCHQQEDSAPWPKAPNANPSVSS